VRTFAHPGLSKVKETDMADRLLARDNGAFEKGIVSIYGDVTIGAVGAPTLVAAKSKGIKSIVRNSAGDYTVTLQDKYAKFFAAWIGFIKATVPAAPSQSIKAINMQAAGGATINFVLYNSAGTATDPASGEELFLEFGVGTSQAV
jgi:hypothetical protein